MDQLFKTPKKPPHKGLLEQLQGGKLTKYSGEDHRDLAFRHYFGNYLLVRHAPYNTIKQASNSIAGKYDGSIRGHGKTLIEKAAAKMQFFLPNFIVIIHSNSIRARESAEFLSIELVKYHTHTIALKSSDLLCETNSDKCNDETLIKILYDLGILPDIKSPVIFITHETNITNFADLKGQDEFLPDYLSAISQNGIIIQDWVKAI